MKYPLLLLTLGALSISSLDAEAMEVQAPSSNAQSTFIVLCDCNTQAKRTWIKHEIKKAGGKIMLTYENLGGFAVKTSKSTDPGQLEQRLRRIPGVNTVELDGEAGINTES
ncbi:hypothetical protein ACXX81_13115 [Pseudomonas sp. GNP013]